jgi:excisionase family DNA binding protein
MRYAREFLHGYGVVLPAWAADWLERNTDLASRRAEVRGCDRAVDEVLIALRAAAMTYRAGSGDGSDSGTTFGATPEFASGSKVSELLSADAAGDLLGISGRAVRRAQQEGRLKGEKVGGRWLFRREDLDGYTRRTA